MNRFIMLAVVIVITVIAIALKDELGGWGGW
jgi:hypothetical protein